MLPKSTAGRIVSHPAKLFSRPTPFVRVLGYVLLITLQIIGVHSWVIFAQRVVLIVIFVFVFVANISPTEYDTHDLNQIVPPRARQTDVWRLGIQTMRVVMARPHRVMWAVPSARDIRKDNAG